MVMDLHAHMSSHEVIGLLGGTWDEERLVICIKAAFPCRPALGSHSSTGVELNPEDEVATRALMERDNLTSIGWSVPCVADCTNLTFPWESMARHIEASQGQG